ncbi:hypothetical protein BD293_0897 [Roseinatronobacter monicus]|uniref:Uncharacterized protein n=1 Tax=Roseinatronobacter monicus TaxID=393481 RepID=A0A543KB46_9RHOB|nr:hypothetical protein BD293_0897 [Roseinatronobacter monicus]
MEVITSQNSNVAARPLPALFTRSDSFVEVSTPKQKWAKTAG